ncbi:hypothetical protein ACLEPN_08705 [Myxococcus sp. 1LA]
MPRIPTLSRPPQAPQYRPPSDNNRPAHPNARPTQPPTKTPGTLGPPAQTFSQGQPPPLRQTNDAVPALNTNRVSTLTHGMPAAYLKPALENGQLSSAYNRQGPNGDYSRRPKDAEGGGALGVYTRAQGTHQDKWQAQGYGVGSNKNNAQLVLNPNLLQNNNGWRASTTDGMGKVPGSSRDDQHGLPQGNPLQRAPLWSKQSEAERNTAFNTTVSGRQSKVQNEQVHWQNIPLNNGNLRGVVVTSPQAFNTVMQTPGAWKSGLPLPTARSGISDLGYIPVGNQQVPVVGTKGETSQASALKLAGVLDKDGHLR